jgi:hypothetical protein
MKTAEDEAFEDIERRQGGGFPAKRAMAADKLHWSDCAVHNGPAYPAGPCDCGVEKEPIAYVTGTYNGRFVVAPLNPAMVLPIGMALYTVPPKRPWVGLTDEDIKEIHNLSFGKDIGIATGLTEAKLKEKNT